MKLKNTDFLDEADLIRQTEEIRIELGNAMPPRLPSCEIWLFEVSSCYPFRIENII